MNKVTLFCTLGIFSVLFALIVMFYAVHLFFHGMIIYGLISTGVVLVAIYLTYMFFNRMEFYSVFKKTNEASK